MVENFIILDPPSVAYLIFSLQFHYLSTTTMMSDIKVDAHAPEPSVSAACTSSELAGLPTQSVPPSPVTVPANSSPLSSGGGVLSLN